MGISYNKSCVVFWLMQLGFLACLDGIRSVMFVLSQINNMLGKVCIAYDLLRVVFTSRDIS